MWYDKNTRLCFFLLTENWSKETRNHFSTNTIKIHRVFQKFRVKKGVVLKTLLDNEDGGFCENSKRLKVFFFRKKLHLRYLTGFWIRLYSLHILGGKTKCNSKWLQGIFFKNVFVGFLKRRCSQKFRKVHRKWQNWCLFLE